MRLLPTRLPFDLDPSTDIDDPDFDTLHEYTDPVNSDIVASFEQPMTDHLIHSEACISQGKEN